MAGNLGISGEDAVRVRPGAHVILVDPDDRILLFRVEDPDAEIPRLWITPGGGLKDGESPEQTAIRELWEETGHIVDRLGPCIWKRDHTFRYHGGLLRTPEDYYFVRVSTSTVSPQQLEEIEQRVLMEHRWWSLAELEGADEVFVPRALAALLRPILEGWIPEEPLIIGE